MLRFVVYLVAGVLLIAVVRAFVNIITRGFSEMMRPNAPDAQTAQRPPVPAGGELKRDPVCGTYIATSASVRKMVKGEMLYFCSTQCRDKYPGA